MSVIEASTIAEARVALRSRPAVIVADYHLGAETSAALLRERPPCVRAVIVSALAEPDALATIARGVGARVLTTPVTDAEADVLIAEVRAGLESG